MIFITGDTHRQWVFKTDNRFKKFVETYPALTKDDYLIIAGDFGGIFSEQTLDDDLKKYADLPVTVLFVDGNHENFDMLDSYSIEQWHGGKVHKIKPDIIHLMRGQIYEIEGKTFFTFGGAISTDKDNRINKFDWWEQEMPNDSEYSEAIENLKKYGNKVDIVVTHTCGERALMYPPLKVGYSQMRVLNDNWRMSYFEEIIDFGHWYFGHYHLDGDLNDRMTVLFTEVRRIV